MKAVFLGDNAESVFLKVYSQESRQRIMERSQLLPQLITSKELEQYKAELQDTEYLFSTWGMPGLTEAKIKEYLPSLKAVFYGAGTVQGFARPFLQNGIQVFSAWAANAVPVAEYTVSQILLANKGYFHYARGLKPPAAFNGNYGEKVGIIGAGMIGSLVIQMLKAYKLELCVFDAFLSEEKIAAMGAKKCSLEEIFSECQTLSNHLANNEHTKGMLNYALFSKMKANGIFINTGRGAQVVEDDLVRAFNEQPGRVALLDVTEPEPPVQGHPFYTMPNIILTPHIAGSIGDEIGRMGEYMVSEFEALLDGRPLRYEVTIKMLETMA